uniref:Uncharacterized protein n=1 Tax=Onchocerca volvulus TaxID=6282 RepID=A0A8R1XP02_ONCVO
MGVCVCVYVCGIHQQHYCAALSSFTHTCIHTHSQTYTLICRCIVVIERGKMGLYGTIDRFPYEDLWYHRLNAREKDWLIELP